MNSIMRQFTSAAALLCATSTTALSAETLQWTLSETAGNVQVANSAGIARKAMRGMRLPAGDAVVTGPKSRAIIVRGQEFVTIAANSKVSVAVPQQGSKVQIIQTRGNAVYKIQKKSTPHFSTQTPYLAAVVKGTTYSVTVGASGASVQVIEGAVQVQPLIGDASFMVLPGMIGTVNRDMPSRLVIGGSVNQQIDGSKGPPVTSPPADTQPVPSFEPADDGAGINISATATDSVINTAISETGVKIADISGGLVSGRSTVGVPGLSRDDFNGNSRSAQVSTTPGSENSVSSAVNGSASPTAIALLRSDINGNGSGSSGSSGGTAGGISNGNDSPASGSNIKGDSNASSGSGGVVVGNGSSGSIGAGVAIGTVIGGSSAGNSGSSSGNGTSGNTGTGAVVGTVIGGNSGSSGSGSSGNGSSGNSGAGVVVGTVIGGSSAGNSGSSGSSGNAAGAGNGSSGNGSIGAGVAIGAVIGGSSAGSSGSSGSSGNATSGSGNAIPGNVSSGITGGGNVSSGSSGFGGSVGGEVGPG